jgi:small subunit ribosomal protein S18
VAELEMETRYEEEQGQSRGGAGRRRGGGGGRQQRFAARRRKTCVFCEDKTASISYRQANALRSFLTDRGKIRPRRQTGTCARHQRQLATAIKRARHLALLPFVVEARRSR